MQVSNYTIIAIFGLLSCFSLPVKEKPCEEQVLCETVENCEETKTVEKVNVENFCDNGNCQVQTGSDFYEDSEHQTLLSFFPRHLIQVQ